MDAVGSNALQVIWQQDSIHHVCFGKCTTTNCILEVNKLGRLPDAKVFDAAINCVNSNNIDIFVMTSSLTNNVKLAVSSQDFIHLQQYDTIEL